MYAIIAEVFYSIAYPIVTCSSLKSVPPRGRELLTVYLTYNFEDPVRIIYSVINKSYANSLNNMERQNK
jgi:hypothetical protein